MSYKDKILHLKEGYDVFIVVLSVVIIMDCDFNEREVDIFKKCEGLYKIKNYERNCMRFNREIIIFNINEIPVIGNFDNGSLIGLTQNGLNFCKQIQLNGIDEEKVPEENRELFMALKESNFFEDDRQENNLHTMSAYLHITQRCNLHCVGCYSLDNNRNRLQDPSIDDLKRALEQLSYNGCKLLVISGGEPFIRDDLAEIVFYAKQIVKIPNVQIITNGTMVTIEKLKNIKKYVDGIAISIDGYSKCHPTYIRDKGIFDSVIHAVKLCKSCNIVTSILPTIHAKNYNCMMDYVKLSKELNVEISFSLLTCSPLDAVLSRWLPTNEQLRSIALDLVQIGIQDMVSVNDMPIGNGLDVRKSCEVGNKIVSIGADGSVYPCHMLHDTNMIMGNIFESELQDILLADLALYCKSLNVDDFEICKECKHKYICGGGCRARSYYVHKNLTSHDFYCPMTKTYFDWLSENIQKIYG